MSSRAGVKGSAFRRAVTSRPARVLITAVVVLTFVWRGYVLTKHADPYFGPSAGLWLMVLGIYLLLRCTWWKQPPAEAGDPLPDRSTLDPSSR